MSLVALESQGREKSKKSPTSSRKATRVSAEISKRIQTCRLAGSFAQHISAIRVTAGEPYCRRSYLASTAQGNLIKMQQERWQVTEWLEETKKELGAPALLCVMVMDRPPERRNAQRGL